MCQNCKNCLESIHEALKAYDMLLRVNAFCPRLPHVCPINVYFSAIWGLIHINSFGLLIWGAKHLDMHQNVLGPEHLKMSLILIYGKTWKNCSALLWKQSTQNGHFFIYFFKRENLKFRECYTITQIFLEMPHSDLFLPLKIVHFPKILCVPPILFV